VVEVLAAYLGGSGGGGGGGKRSSSGAEIWSAAYLVGRGTREKESTNGPQLSPVMLTRPHFDGKATTFKTKAKTSIGKAKTKA